MKILKTIKETWIDLVQTIKSLNLLEQVLIEKFRELDNGLESYCKNALNVSFEDLKKLSESTAFSMDEYVMLVCRDRDLDYWDLINVSTYAQEKNISLQQAHSDFVRRGLFNI